MFYQLDECNSNNYKKREVRKYILQERKENENHNNLRKN